MPFLRKLIQTTKSNFFKFLLYSKLHEMDTEENSIEKLVHLSYSVRSFNYMWSSDVGWSFKSLSLFSVQVVFACVSFNFISLHTHSSVPFEFEQYLLHRHTKFFSFEMLNTQLISITMLNSRRFIILFVNFWPNIKWLSRFHFRCFFDFIVSSTGEPASLIWQKKVDDLDGLFSK